MRSHAIARKTSAWAWYQSSSSSQEFLNLPREVLEWVLKRFGSKYRFTIAQKHANVQSVHMPRPTMTSLCSTNHHENADASVRMLRPTMTSLCSTSGAHQSSWECRCVGVHAQAHCDFFVIATLLYWLFVRWLYIFAGYFFYRQFLVSRFHIIDFAFAYVFNDYAVELWCSIAMFC